MRHSILLLCGSLFLVSTGCGKTAAVRAPTRVVPEEPDRVDDRVARAASEEQEPPAEKKEPQPPEPVVFNFPADRGGELLSKELTPSPVRSLPESAAQPRRAKILAHLEAPELPLPPTPANHAALPPEKARKPLLPRLVTPETLINLALESALPEAQPMPVGVRTREPGADVNQPAALPILGQPVPDRASLNDATGEASGAAIIAAMMPRRQNTVPFLRLSVPDPYENYRPLRLTVPAEATDPITASPSTPK